MYFLRTITLFSRYHKVWHGPPELTGLADGTIIMLTSCGLTCVCVGPRFKARRKAMPHRRKGKSGATNYVNNSYVCCLSQLCMVSMLAELPMGCVARYECKGQAKREG